MYIKLLLIMFFISQNSYSQKSAEICERIFSKAQTLFKRASYDSAINKLAAYKVCNPDGVQKADSLIKEIYKEVNNQRKEAILQKMVAEKRAKIILNQKDSIEKENISNKIATEAMQIKQLNPTDALHKTQVGLCFSPKNPSLLEIRKSILSEEVLMKKMSGASPFGTLCAKQLKGNLYLTGDIMGYLCLWRGDEEKPIWSKKLFNGEIRYLENIDYSGSLIMYSGVEKKKGNKSIFILGYINLITAVQTSVYQDTISECKFLTNLGDSNTIVFSVSNRYIRKFSFRDQSVKLIKSIDENITGLACWQGIKKIYYATNSAVYSVGFDLPIFQAPQESSITLLSFCEYRADLYIGIGSDIVIYDCTSKNKNLLYPLHDHQVTSCSCSEKMGGFLTTSLDGYAALWTPPGNKNRVLKGNNSELYCGFISEDANYIITTGLWQLISAASDTSTVKYWYLNTFLKGYEKEAHLFGSDCSAYDPGNKLYYTGGHDGNIKIWNEKMELLKDIKIHKSGISALFFDTVHKKLLIGTFDGNTGFVSFTENKKFTSEFIQTHYEYVTGITEQGGKIYSTGKDGSLYIQQINNKPADSLYFDESINSIQFNRRDNVILLSAGNTAIVYNINTHKRLVFRHNFRVFMSRWLNEQQFITVSDDVLRIWSVQDTVKALISKKNNISNTMTSVVVDSINKLIYTGTWSGYIICWDFSGNQLFMFDKLTSLANTNLIKSLTLNSNSSELFVTDYNGTVSLWLNPFYFLETRLNIKVNCGHYIELLKK